MTDFEISFLLSWWLMEFDKLGEKIGCAKTKSLVTET